MLNVVDLKKRARKAYLSTYEDGLWDMFFGVIVAAMGFFLYHPASGYSAINIIVYLVVITVANSLFMAAKKHITLPRMGHVTFGPARQKRKRTLAIVLGIVVFLQAILVISTATGWFSQVLTESLLGGYTSEQLVVAWVSSLFVGIPMLIIAYVIDFPRGYYIAIMMALAVFLMILTNQPAYPVVIGIFIFVPGLVLFIRFLRKYPLQPGDEQHG